LVLLLFFIFRSFSDIGLRMQFSTIGVSPFRTRASTNRGLSTLGPGTGVRSNLKSGSTVGTTVFRFFKHFSLSGLLGRVILFIDADLVNCTDGFLFSDLGLEHPK